MNEQYKEWSMKPLDEKSSIIQNDELFEGEVAGILGELAFCHADDPQYQIIVNNLNTLVNARINYLRPDLDMKRVKIDLQKAETETVKAETEFAKLDIERERVAVEDHKVKVEARKVEVDQKQIEEERKKLANQIICECIKLIPRILGICVAFGMTKFWFQVEQELPVNKMITNRIIDWITRS